MKSWWSYVKQFFRSLFTCCTTGTNYSYGLDAYSIISADQDLQKRVNSLLISTLEATKGKNRSKAVTKISPWRLTTTAIESLIFDGLVPDVFPRIFSNLDFRALQASCCVSKTCHKLASDQNEQTRQKAEGIAFGKAEWKAMGLNMGDEPLIPSSLVNGLEWRDPVDPTQTVGDTHMLVLVPAGLTLKSLGVLVKSRFPGSEATGYRYIQDRILNQLSTPNERSYWVLMKKDVIPGSKRKLWGTGRDGRNLC
ncbi:MAG: hypothetical protein H0T62_03410 [Parachlamydiaceae bacterium]|nr:hypothetical protein [Parachlamydiaceae bacterium]